MVPSQPACKFETYKASHAMTKEAERLIQIWKKCLRSGSNESRKSVKRLLNQPCLASRELNRPDFNCLRHSVHPCTKDCGSAACVRETEKAQPRLRIWLVV